MKSSDTGVLAGYLGATMVCLHLQARDTGFVIARDMRHARAIVQRRGVASLRGQDRHLSVGFVGMRVDKVRNELTGRLGGGSHNIGVVTDPQALLDPSSGG